MGRRLQVRLLLRHLKQNLRRMQQVRCDSSDSAFQRTGMQADRQVAMVAATLQLAWQS